jgi:hypothetical protein
MEIKMKKVVLATIIGMLFVTSSYAKDFKLVVNNSTNLGSGLGKGYKAGQKWVIDYGIAAVIEKTDNFKEPFIQLGYDSPKSVGPGPAPFGKELTKMQTAHLKDYIFSVGIYKFLVPGYRTTVLWGFQDMNNTYFAVQNNIYRKELGKFSLVVGYIKDGVINFLGGVNRRTEQPFDTLHWKIKWLPEKNKLGVSVVIIPLKGEKLSINVYDGTDKNIFKKGMIGFAGANPWQNAFLKEFSFESKTLLKAKK